MKIFKVFIYLNFKYINTIMSFIDSIIKNSHHNSNDSNLQLLMYNSTQNPSNHDQIIIHNSSYNINPYLQLLIYTQNIHINPFNLRSHDYDLKSLIHHPSIDPFNKQFLNEYFNSRR